MITLELEVVENAPGKVAVHLRGAGDATPDEVAMANLINDAVTVAIQQHAIERGSRLLSIQRDLPPFEELGS